MFIRYNYQIYQFNLILTQNFTRNRRIVKFIHINKERVKVRIFKSAIFNVLFIIGLENILTQSSRSGEINTTDNLIQINYISFKSHEYKLQFDIK
jgi:hypothetical protein